MRDPAPSIRSADCETTIVCGRYPRNRCCPRDERKNSASAKQDASGSRAGSGRTSTICCLSTPVWCPGPLARSWPTTFRRRSIRTSWTPFESRRSHPSKRSTSTCPQEAGRSGSTPRGIPDFASLSLKRMKSDAPCVTTTSGSATACSDWRPLISGGIPTTAGTWCRTAWRCAGCITRRWTGVRWGWRRAGEGFGFWCQGGCGGGVRRRAGWWGCGGGGCGRRRGRGMRRIGGA